MPNLKGLKQASPFTTTTIKCPKCGNSLKKVKYSDGTVEIEHCNKCDKIRGIYSAAGFRKRHKLMTFEKWNGEIPQEIKSLKTDCLKNIIITGNNGTGKTHLIVAFAHKLIIEAAMPIKFINSAELFFEIKKTFQNDTETTADDLINLYSGYPILIIDDLGAERISEWVREVLYLIINRRYENVVPTLITTNYSTKGLYDNFDKKIASRLLADAIIVKMTGEDKRISK